MQQQDNHSVHLVSDSVGESHDSSSTKTDLSGGLHAAIMNIPAWPLASKSWRRYEEASDEVMLAYKEGHRDARHAAAELALQADAIKAELLGALQALDECYCSARDDMSRAERDHARKVLMSARAAIAKATAVVTNPIEADPK